MHTPDAQQLLQAVRQGFARFRTILQFRPKLDSLPGQMFPRLERGLGGLHGGLHPGQGGQGVGHAAGIKLPGQAGTPHQQTKVVAELVQASFQALYIFLQRGFLGQKRLQFLNALKNGTDLPGFAVGIDAQRDEGFAQFYAQPGEIVVAGIGLDLFRSRARL